MMAVWEHYNQRKNKKFPTLVAYDISINITVWWPKRTERNTS